MTLTRRQFLQVSFTATGALVVASCTGSSSRTAPRNTTTTAGAAGSEGEPFTPNLFIRIDPDGSVTLTVHRTEMGQGVRTSLAMILADELDAPWDRVTVVQSPANTQIGPQLTSGSGSVAGAYSTLRSVGAAARGILVATAAKVLAVPVAECRADQGTVVHDPSGRKLTYAELVGPARDVKPASSTPPKDPKQFRLIGTAVPRVEHPAIVTGKATYGLDARADGMVFAAVARCPVPLGTVTSFDAASARAVAGVLDVVQISNGVAVVASNTWAAFQGKAALKVAFDEGKLASVSEASNTAALDAGLQRLLDLEGPAPSGAIEATYEFAYQAHAPMEPQNCLVSIADGRCTVHAPTQNPQDVQEAVAKVVGVPTDVIVTNVGGGFGRRLEHDWAVEAAEVAKAFSKPVQVVWTREDDFAHDFYRPPSKHRMRATLANGAIASWRHLVAGPGLNGVVYQVGAELLEDGLDVSYTIPDNKVRNGLAGIPVPTGPWRAVLDGPNAFANEGFLDELSVLLKKDPLDLRLSLLADDDLLKPVLQAAADKAGWRTPVAADRGRGIACHQRADTPVAMVAEVSVDAGKPHVHKVVCAVDCGIVIQPDMVAQQMEGGIVFGLTSFLKSGITFDKGRAQQSNFNDFPLLQMAEMPAVEVVIVPSTRQPAGVGEMAVPPIVPAVANALFALTGKRIRHAPLRPGDL